MQAWGNGRWLLALIGCLAVLGLLVAVMVLRVDVGSLGFLAVLLLCPLLHLFMMRGAGHGGQVPGQQVPTKEMPASTSTDDGGAVSTANKGGCH